jgi:hypothetical protein
MKRVEKVEEVPVTCYKCVPETKTVTVKVNKCVPYEATRTVTKCVPVQETVTATRMVCREVQKQVPVEAAPCCNPCCDEGHHHRLFSH